MTAYFHKVRDRIHIEAAAASNARRGDKLAPVVVMESIVGSILTLLYPPSRTHDEESFRTRAEHEARDYTAVEKLNEGSNQWPTARKI